VLPFDMFDAAADKIFLLNIIVFIDRFTHSFSHKKILCYNGLIISAGP